MEIHDIANERHLTKLFIRAVKTCNLYSVKNIFSGDTISRKKYGDIFTKYFGQYAPIIVAKPDVVLIVEDHKKLIDEWLIIAIELKYFKQVDRKRWREAYREIGQALRYYVYGFDSAILCHIFMKEIDDCVVKAYSDVIGEVIEKLKLPIVYFSMKISNVENLNKFLVFKPVEISNPSDICYIVKWLINCCRDGVRNPLLPHDKEIIDRRKILKTIFQVP